MKLKRCARAPSSRSVPSRPIVFRTDAERVLSWHAVIGIAELRTGHRRRLLPLFFLPDVPVVCSCSFRSVMMSRHFCSQTSRWDNSSAQGENKVIPSDDRIVYTSPWRFKSSYVLRLYTLPSSSSSSSVVSACDNSALPSCLSFSATVCARARVSKPRQDKKREKREGRKELKE